jgi:hypothetical protein
MGSDFDIYIFEESNNLFNAGVRKLGGSGLSISFFWSNLV